jgi:hypothetical protein
MIFIVGSAYRPKRLQPLLDTHCFGCNRVTTWDWHKVTEWISAFFIPLLPITDEHYLRCSGCGDTLRLTREQVDGVKRRVQLSTSESQHLHDALVAALEAQQLKDKTDTQREFLKARRTATNEGSP